MENQDASNFVPLALVAMAVLVYLTWSLPRTYAVCPLLAMTCLMPLGQQLVLFGLHFPMFRILLLVGVLRVMTRGEAAGFKLTRMDKMFLWWAAATVILGSLAKPSSELLINRLGEAYSALGCYFFVRWVTRDFEDVLNVIRALALGCVVLGGLMLVEKATGHNWLSVFGGVPEITGVRDGHLRCQGAFRHPILAGTFGAIQVPIFAALWYYRPRERKLAAAALLAAGAIVVTASSSGALMALIAGAAGLGLWRFRQHMRALRWAVLLGTLGLALVMKAPIWYLFARLSDITGGTGWHRAYLIDQAIGFVDEWWLFGTTYTAHWGPGGKVIAADPNMMDITNQYIVEGVRGGMLRLVLFITIIVQCFAAFGRGMRVESDRGTNWTFLLWTLGVALLAHCLSFMSITYFDQIVVAWYWLLAVAGCVYAAVGEYSWQPEAEACGEVELG